VSLANASSTEHSVRGQYGDGVIGDDRVPACRSEPGLSPESRTETFVALKLNIDNWRWAGVPFYLRTGKRLARRHTEITIQFKKTPFEIFCKVPVNDTAPPKKFPRSAAMNGIHTAIGNVLRT